MSGQTIALSLFLVLLAIGSIILIGSVIVIKRTVALRKSRIGRIIYTPIGNGAPKFWKELINSRINSTVKIRTEPRVFCPSKSDLQNDASERNLGFQFRAKTVDLFIDLKEKILESYPHLEAPPVRNIRDFLMASLKFMNPQPNRELVESYCKLYNRARHDPGAYTDVDYLRFLEIHDQFLKAVIIKTDSRISDSPSKSSLARTHQKRSTARFPLQDPKESSSSEFIELKKVGETLQAKFGSSSDVMIESNNVAADSGGGVSVLVDSVIRTPLSRSGSAASDDSQTALIRLDHDGGGGGGGLGGNHRTASSSVHHHLRLQ